MDTDLLEFGSDTSTDSGDLYNDMAGLLRRAAPSANSTLVIHRGMPNDKEEPTVASPVNTLPALKPDPPAAHPQSVQMLHYKSPGPATDGVDRSRPELLPKSIPLSVPAIPPRKPRPPAPNPEATLSKASQPQPPLPHIMRKSVVSDSLVNRTYGIAMVENPQRHSMEVNVSTPPVPVPRNVNLLQVRQPAALNQSTAAAADSPVPCDSLSSDEQVR